jgi:hypothetical protein
MVALNTAPMSRSPRRTSPIRVVLLGAVAVLVALGAGRIGQLLPDIHNPFGSRTVDHSPPAVLHALNDLADYHAASAQYQTTLDIEKDANYLPAFLKGDRTLFLAAGSVDGVVDFSHLGGDAVKIDGDHVTITLPHAHLTAAQVDPQQSHVVTQQRGVLDRLGSIFSDTPSGERHLYLLAQDKLNRAAAADPQLTQRTEDNTRAMLTQLLHGLGFKDVRIVFADAPGT